MNILRKRIEKEQFEPGLLGIFVNPFYFARKALLHNMQPLLSQISGVTLDVGCGKKPYEKFCRSLRYVGLELDTPENRIKKKANIYYHGGRLPFTDSEFDSLIINQVFEHIFEPESFLKELNRVLKSEGMLLITVPFIWDEHEQPNDFGRYTSFGLRTLLERYGFAILEQRKSGNGIEVIFQLLNCYLYKKLFTKKNLLCFIVTFVLIIPVNVLGTVLSKMLPRNSDLFLDNVILARKVKNV